jgi:Rod binding domain-containing protein
MTELPRIADAALPAEIRNGTEADKKAYRAALGFEAVFVDQLLKAAKLGGEGPHEGTVRDALSASLSNGGGLGLAGRLHKSMQEHA